MRNISNRIKQTNIRFQIRSLTFSSNLTVFILMKLANNHPIITVNSLTLPTTASQRSFTSPHREASNHRRNTEKILELRNRPNDKLMSLNRTSDRNCRILRSISFQIDNNTDINAEEDTVKRFFGGAIMDPNRIPATNFTRGKNLLEKNRTGMIEDLLNTDTKI